jgi:hypothetical protein
MNPSIGRPPRRIPGLLHRRLTETPYNSQVEHCLESGARLPSCFSLSVRLLTTRLQFRSFGEEDVFTRVQHGFTDGVDLRVGSSEFA